MRCRSRVEAPSLPLFTPRFAVTPTPFTDLWQTASILLFPIVARRRTQVVDLLPLLSRAFA
jgi:hypothetical protein